LPTVAAFPVSRFHSSDTPTPLRPTFFFAASTDDDSLAEACLILLLVGAQVPTWYLWYMIIQFFFPVAVVEEAVGRGYMLDRLMPQHPASLVKALPAILLSSLLSKRIRLINSSKCRSLNSQCFPNISSFKHSLCSRKNQKHHWSSAHPFLIRCHATDSYDSPAIIGAFPSVFMRYFDPVILEENEHVKTDFGRYLHSLHVCLEDLFRTSQFWDPMIAFHSLSIERIEKPLR
jgi:hypothetical protein